MVAVGGHDAQCADYAETAGAAGEMTDGAAEADAASDLLLVRQTGFPRPADVAMGVTVEGAVERVDRDVASAADAAGSPAQLTDGLSSVAWQPVGSVSRGGCRRIPIHADSVSNSCHNQKFATGRPPHPQDLCNYNPRAHSLVFADGFRSGRPKSATVVLRVRCLGACTV
jgi:hypothetical protein